MKQAVIVVFDFAQFQEIQTCWNKKNRTDKEEKNKTVSSIFLTLSPERAVIILINLNKTATQALL